MRRKAARSNILDFTTFTKPDYRVWWHHRRIARALDRWERGEIKRLMIFCPPQVGKSELVSRRLPAYMLGRNPSRKILSCEHSASLAEAMNRDVQRIIDDEPFRRLFPAVRLGMPKDHGVKRTDEIFEVVGGTGSLRSAGVRMKIAGQPAHAGIIDDPFGSMADADSAIIRQAVWEWYTNDFYARLSKDAPVLITHTRWNRDDLAGRLLIQMADKSSDQWEIINLPAIRPDNWIDPEDPREPGEALWPDHKSVADLEVIRKQNPRGYAALYQQDPKAAGSEFPAEWFGDGIWFDEWPTYSTGIKIATCDPSKGKGDKYGDYSAFIKLLWAHGKIWIDADMANDRNMATIIDTALDVQMRWRPEQFGIEAELFQELIGDDIFARAQAMGLLFPLCQITHQGINKQVRIRRLTPWLSKGILRFKGGSPGAQLLVEQLQDFPTGEHDDGPDALEMAIRILLVLVNGQADDGLGAALPLNIQ